MSDQGLAVVAHEMTVTGGIERRYEVYLTLLAITEDGARLELAIPPEPRVARGVPVSFGFQGALLYAGQPQGYLAFVTSVIESDQGIRDLGTAWKRVMESRAVEVARKAVAAEPNPSLAVMVGFELLDVVAGALERNGDDVLLRRSGGLYPPDWGIGTEDTFTNDRASLRLAVRPWQRVPFGDGSGEVG